VGRGDAGPLDGDVRIKVTNTGGKDAVIEGVFLG
jgi:hypothetical protein